MLISPRFSVVRAKKLRWVIDPAILTRHGIRGVQRVIDAVVFFVRLAHHQQPHLFGGVVDKGMAHAGSGGKTDAISRLELPQIAVNPRLRVALQHVDEFLFIALCMRVRGAAAGRQPFVVNTEMTQP